MRLASLALVLAVLAVRPASAQERVVSFPVNAESQCVLEAPAHDHHYHGVRQLREAYDTGAKTGNGLVFDVTYTGFSAQAQAAFQFALDIWSAHLESAVPIVLDANFEALQGNVLGSAGAACVYGLSQPIPNTFYGAALADAIAGRDLWAPGGACPTPTDIRARFASNRSDWYFGTDGNTPAGRIDFVTVVMHEVGHGLGFFGSANYDDGVTNSTNPDECAGVGAGFGCFPFSQPFIFDRFAEDGAGNSILNGSLYPNFSMALGSLLRSQDLFFDSPTTVAVYGSRPPIWAPASWEPGSSFSHWDEGVIPTGDANALMTPELAFGESFPDPGPLTCALMQDIGWTLNAACAALVVDDEDGPLAVEGVEIEAAGPNPFREATALRVRLGEPQAVRATLHDALGREVAVLHEGTAPAGVLTLPVAGDLAPGAYTVVVRAEAGRASASLIRVR